MDFGFLLVPFQPLYDVADRFSEIMGITKLDSLYIVMFQLVSLLGVFYRIIPRKWTTTKLLYNLMFGIFVVGVQHGVHIIHPILTGLYGFALIKTTSVRLCPWIMLIVSFTHLTLLTSVFPPDYGSSWNAAPGYMLLQMMMTLKLCALPFNLLDSYHLSEDEEEFKKRMGRDTEIHKKFAIHEKPSVLEYFSFVWHFQTIGCGPVGEFSTYKKFIECDPPVPNDFFGLIYRWIQANFCLGMYSMIKDTIGANCVDFAAENFHGNESLLNLAFMTYLAILGTRFRLYTGLVFAEVACIGSGLGYTGIERRDDGTYKKYLWEDVRTSNAKEFEFGISMRVLMNNWNVGIQKWLRYYIYNRVVIGGHFIRMLIPMIVSAIWHGVFAGYIVMWISMTFLNMMYIQVYKKFPHLVDRKSMNWVTYLICWFILHTFLSHFCVGFVLFKLGDLFEYYCRFYFAGHILCFSLLFLLRLFPNAKKRNKKNKEKKET